MNIDEMRKKNSKQLFDEILLLLKEQFNLRMQISKEKKKTHLFSRSRKNIARIKTILKERERSSNVKKK
ncbi:50S ribosomal protein L29 [bacterium endosymbiont of Pedicinus badii]|uniref:50S ribosomal protein L29 n=1 Tax=bacterium endosymbiont of Pedicinus badii TaxID=1719126 RepID=UPI0009B955C0|nr:50S ribosomal protein L29 [bacterium endosymbiont of Pedicinus badii]OQM34108.1 hypothetical protein AOQ89_02060 [bacterium endosymbiont of Pedicinus badii]